MHWVDIDASAFTALDLGLEPVLGLYQYLDEERPSLAFWGLEVPAEADVDATRLRGLAAALTRVADKVDEITGVMTVGQINLDWTSDDRGVSSWGSDR
ncbi:hypothetical protein AB3M81_01875 [Aeromicrobium sp. 179-A 4D2 NHS]